MLFIDAYINFTEYIPIIVITLFNIIANILIYLSGKKQSEDIINSKLLKLIGLFNILFYTIALFFPPIQIYYYSVGDELFNYIYFVFRFLISTVPFLLTYGVLMFKFGKINFERYGLTLKRAGILGIIGYALTVPFIFYIFSIQLAFFAYFSSFGGIFLIVEYILLIIHGKKNRDVYIGVSGIISLIGMLVTAIISGLLISLELLLI